MPLTSEQINFNWSSLKEIIEENVTSKRKNRIMKLLEDIEDVLITAPCSTTSDYHGAYPGGLVEYSLKTYSALMNMAEDESLSNVSANADFVETAAIIAILHRIGLAGLPGKPLMNVKDSSWHNERGIFFEYSKELPFLTPADRTLWLLQKYQIPLKTDEYVAIMTHANESRSQDYKFAQSPWSVFLGAASELSILTMTSQSNQDDE